MVTIHLVLLVLAVFAFLGAALDVKAYRLNLMGTGLFLWALAEVLLMK